jgi:choice-of-anchor A domain-containing protein
MKIIGNKFFLLSAGLGFLAIQSAVHAGVLGVAEEYNAFIFQNMNQTSDTEGALAVGGNLILNNYSVGLDVSGSNTNLVVGGSLTFHGGSINGSTVVGGNATFTNTAPAGNVTVGGNYTSDNQPSGTVFYKGTFSAPSWANPGVAVSSVTLPVDFSAAQTSLTQTSTSLKSMPSTGSFVDSFGSLTFTGTNAGLNVFSIAANTLDSSNGITITIPSGAFAIVNVTGSTSVSLPNVGLNFNSADVLWNLSGVTTLSMSSFDGSILAPSANVTFNSGALNGTLVANSLSGGGQLNEDLFQHTVLTPSFGPTVPLPASVEGGLVLLAGMGIVGAYRRRRKIAS